MRAIVMLV